MQMHMSCNSGKDRRKQRRKLWERKKERRKINPARIRTSSGTSPGSQGTLD